MIHVNISLMSSKRLNKVFLNKDLDSGPVQIVGGSSFGVTR